MALPLTQNKWIITGTKNGLDEFKFIEGPISDVGENQVLVKLHAASLNPKDILTTKGEFPWSMRLPVVGGSDGAGEVIEVGARVTKWEKGDRVATLFNPGHQFGPLTLSALDRGPLGGTVEGSFQEYGVFDELGLVRLAGHLSYFEGAALSDAAVTAWNALYGLKPIVPGQWVLLQGTGGVSLSALQFAKAGGAKVVITTSSPQKCDIVKHLGADHVINYVQDPNWGLTARNLTPGGVGFDHILEVGGYDTFSHSFEAIKIEGIITIIGFTSGRTPPDNIGNILMKICTVRGVHVGSRVQMEEMMEAMEVNGIKPVLDPTVFTLSQIRDGLEYLDAKKHVGKVIVRID